MQVCNRIEANTSGRIVCAYFSGASPSADIGALSAKETPLPYTGEIPSPSVEETPPPSAETVIFANGGPAYPGVGNGSTSGPNQ